MSCKSLKILLEITIATLNEELQTKDTLNAFSEAIVESAEGFAKEVASESNGMFLGTAKIIEKSEDWE